MAGLLQGKSVYNQCYNRNLFIDAVRFGRGGYFLPTPDGVIPASTVISLHTWFNLWLDIPGNTYEQRFEPSPQMHTWNCSAAEWCYSGTGGFWDWTKMLTMVDF